MKSTTTTTKMSKALVVGGVALFSAALLALAPAVHAGTLFEETFSIDSTEAEFAAKYPLWTVTKHQGNPSLEVAGGRLFLRFGGSNLGVSATIDASSFAGPIQIEAELGGGDGVTSQPCNYNTVLVIGNNNVVFHPECTAGGIRGHLRIDGPGGFFNQDVGWVPAENVLHRLVVASDGTGNFTGTLTDGTNPANKYTFGWTNAGAVGTTIGFRRYGHGPGDGFFSRLTILPAVTTVTIDVKNSINPRSKGMISVAILTTDTFDATTVDPLSVAFGPNGAMEAHGQGHIEDADEDSDLDLVLHFRTQDTGIQCGETSASLTGETFDGQAIEGSDSIKTVGCN